MDGVIVLNKEKNLTSRDCVNKLNKILNTKKIGHTGTLDPIAEGVLVMAIGSYTSLVDLITSFDKEYIATVKLGIKTDTFDITGKVIEEKSCQVTKEKLLDCFKAFTKTYEQEVPIYSAVKINGKKLYEYARENIAIEVPKRPVTIYSLELLSLTEDSFTFKTKVSKGTYIRSLINDICTYLGIIGTMSSLVRTKQGQFSIDEAYTINDVLNNKYQLLKVEDLFSFPKINGDKYRKLLINGNKLSMDLADGKYFIMLDNKVKAIYEFTDNIGRIIFNL